MTDPRLSSILASYNLTLSQRMGLERDIGEMMKPSESIAALVEAYGKAARAIGDIGLVGGLPRVSGRVEDYRCTKCGQHMKRSIDFEEYQHFGCGGLVELERFTDAKRVRDAAKSALLAALTAPAIDSARPSWESTPNGQHEMWWTLDVHRNGDRELYAIVKERDDCPTATWAVPAQGDGDDHAALAEGVAASVDAAQLAAESALRTIARGIDAAIAAVPSEILAAAREVMRLDAAFRAAKEAGDGRTVRNALDELWGVAQEVTPRLAAWVIAQAEGRGE